MDLGAKIVHYPKKIIKCQKNLAFSEDIRLVTDLKQKCGFWNRGHVVFDIIAGLAILFLLFESNIPLWTVMAISILVGVCFGFLNYRAECKIKWLLNEKL